MFQDVLSYRKLFQNLIIPGYLDGGGSWFSNSSMHNRIPTPWKNYSLKLIPKKIFHNLVDTLEQIFEGMGHGFSCFFYLFPWHFQRPPVERLALLLLKLFTAKQSSSNGSSAMDFTQQNADFIEISGWKRVKNRDLHSGKQKEAIENGHLWLIYHDLPIKNCDFP